MSSLKFASLVFSLLLAPAFVLGEEVRGDTAPVEPVNPAPIVQPNPVNAVPPVQNINQARTPDPIAPNPGAPIIPPIPNNVDRPILDNQNRDPRGEFGPRPGERMGDERGRPFVSEFKPNGGEDRKDNFRDDGVRPREMRGNNQTDRKDDRSDENKEKSKARKDRFNEDEEPRDFVDPRQISDALRQIKEVRRETNRLLKRTKSLKLEAPQSVLNSLLEDLKKSEDAINNAEDGKEQEPVQDFFESRAWEVVQKVRIEVELPSELQRVESELKRLEKTISVKNFSLEGIDTELIRAKITEIREAVNTARAAMAENNPEEAQVAMHTIYEGSHPGDINGVVQQMKEISSALKRIKSAEIKESMLDLLAPVFEAVEEGDFREANMALNEARREIMPLMGKVQKLMKMNPETQRKIQMLEKQIEDKLNEGDGRQSYAPYTFYQKASVLDMVRDLFGW
ncbi:MAG: hypothetical protein HZA95_00875 [Candidatus Vogelbacteria bacterium]|nr:hypothetical protein [Candidatus Vogelbacteria bacterium]